MAKRTDRTGGPVTLRVRVRARAPADGIEADVPARELMVSVTAPAVEGKANRAMLAQLAERLGIARSSLQIISGEKSRRKLVRIHGLGEAEVWRRLAGRPEGGPQSGPSTGSGPPLRIAGGPSRAESRGGRAAERKAQP